METRRSLPIAPDVFPSAVWTCDLLKWIEFPRKLHCVIVPKIRIQCSNCPSRACRESNTATNSNNDSNNSTARAPGCGYQHRYQPWRSLGSNESPRGDWQVESK